MPFFKNSLPIVSVFNNLGGESSLEAEALAQLREAGGMPVAVACSGGPDSVALAYVVCALHDGPVTLLHFNHKLRGEHSDGDEAFVRELGKSLGCDVRVGQWANPSTQNETAARDARLAWLHQWEHKLILFGQHGDDAVETLLMRLARGSGMEGLTAPHAVVEYGQHVHLRPLLKLRKIEIVKALEELGVAYRVDASNLESDYLRNKIRNELIPLWQSFEQRDVVAGILASRDRLREAREYEAVSEGAQEFQSYDRVNLIVGTTLCLPCGFVLEARRVPTPSKEELMAKSNPVGRVWVRDVDGLSVETWQPGQRYRPMGIGGSRKIKNILNEQAGDVPAALRALWPVVSVGNEALWLPGARVVEGAGVDFQKPTAIELRFGVNLSTLTDNA